MSGRIPSFSALCAILAACLGATAITVPAAADEHVEFEFRFAYSSSQLETERGAADLYASLTAEARRACQTGSSFTLVPLVDKTCVADVVASVVAAIDAPLLTAEHTASPVYALAQADIE